jgi:hypothetical protein
MGRFAIALLFVWCAAPALAGTPHRGECLQLTKQIARYERDAKWAEERGNEMWEQGSLAQAKRLSDRRASLCPEYAKKNPVSQTAAMIGEAAKVAASYFMGGL